VCAGGVGHFQQTDRRCDFYRLDFLRPRRRGHFPYSSRLGGRPIPYRVPGYPWTPIFFVLVAAAIVGNAIYLAFRDPSQFKNLAVAILLFSSASPPTSLAQTRLLLNSVL